MASSSSGGPPARVLVVSGSVGAGHDAAAGELAVRLRIRGVQVEVRDLLTALPRPLPTVLGAGYGPCVDRAPAAFEAGFHQLERGGPLWRAQQVVARSALPTLRRWCAEAAPGLVVSTHPLASQALGELRLRGQLVAPVVTYLTDPAVHRTWLHRGVAAHLTVGEATAEHGRSAYGVRMTVAGPLVPARFARPVPPEVRAGLRRGLTAAGGTAADPVVALVSAGSLGIGAVVSTVADLCATGSVPVVLCGRNAGLRRTITGMAGAVALGWRDDVAELMAAADVLVHNAGGMSCTEAWVAGLPIVTHRPIPGHGRANAAVLAAAGIAPWTTTRAGLGAAVRARSGRPRTRTDHPDPARFVLDVLGARPVLVPAG